MDAVRYTVYLNNGNLKVREVKRELSRTMRTQLRNLTTRLREYNNMKVRYEEGFDSQEINA